jgi:hypothetical protein
MVLQDPWHVVEMRVPEQRAVCVPVLRDARGGAWVGTIQLMRMLDSSGLMASKSPWRNAWTNIAST